MESEKWESPGRVGTQLAEVHKGAKKKKKTLIIHCFLEEMEFSELIEKTFLNFSAFLYFLSCCVVDTSPVVSFTYASPSTTAGAMEQGPCLILTPWQCLAECLVHSRCSVNANWIHIRKQAKVLYTTVAQAIPRGVLSPKQRIASLRPFWVD